MSENCTDCLFAEERPSLLEDGETWYKCANENAPYYGGLVHDTKSCRLFIDYENYIKLKDRKGAMDKLINKRL